MAIESVDQFLQEKVRPELRDVVAMLRELMREEAPAATEIISYGILAWRVRRIIAVVSPTKKDITFAFSQGAAFDDEYGLLRGVGKVSKHVKIPSVAAANVEALRSYVRQAIDHEAR